MSAPLLLMDRDPDAWDTHNYARSLEGQVNSARCNRDDFDVLFVCVVDVAAVPYALPVEFGDRTRIGCVNLSTGREQDWRSRSERGVEVRESYLLFAGREGWRAAWRLARLLEHSVPGRVATIDADELPGALFIIRGEKHPLHFA